VRLFALVVALVVATSSPVRADEDTTRLNYRAVVDRVELEPATIGGQRLKVYLSALDLGGHLLDISDPKTIRLFINNSEKKFPYALGTYKEVHDETAIVFVVQATQSYAEVLPIILETLDSKLLGELAEQGTQIAVLGYGDTTGNGKLASLKVGRQKLAGLVHDGSDGEPGMTDTIERALTLLRRAKSASVDPEQTVPQKGVLRKMIILVGDGRDRANDRDRVTYLGKKAAKEGVRIHSLAFTPDDVRRPLLALGELSKQSFGTFRWVRAARADSWGPSVALLSDEIEKQNVITFFPGTDAEVGGKKLKITIVGRTEAQSNELKIPDAGCNGAPCTGYCAADRCVLPKAPESRGVFGWILMIGGIGIGGIVVLGVIGAIIQKKTAATIAAQGPLPPGVAAPPGSVPPGSMPPGSIGSKPPKVKKSKQPSLPPAPVGPTTTAGLFVMTGPRAGERIPLVHGFTIGKLPTNSLVIDDGYASSNHAVITVDQAGGCKLFDQGSTNGTYCNGVRVAGEYHLQSGVVIQIGSTQLRFLAE